MVKSLRLAKLSTPVNRGGAISVTIYTEHSKVINIDFQFNFRIKLKIKFKFVCCAAPLFIFQWLFDEAQMLADNVGPPMSKEQWDYIHAVGDDLRRTFANVSAVFSPSCISHTVLTKRDWQSIRIGDISLPQALRCWELQPYWSVSNHLASNGGHHQHRHHHSRHREEEEEELDQEVIQHTVRHGHKRYKAAPVDAK